ncbi:hypothetical protein [Roseinatronobacter bogoriensis]|uniref:hypothetical protein n=1 Tax=Roseinatronobacter bogoriensis TaxID=119542 RepID=UPI0010D97805|nr:hypothetical protein [Rhodobaca bogoriensis]MBB4207244.1 hypothetical protein [Rhodobaca bogoriensis DSM 18756]TDY65745.1 hypothetical protein EV660_11713 [Rhodobaca bogoriensis DSM 18756]
MMDRTALTHHATQAATEEQRASARALLDELSRGKISRTAACEAMTAAAARRSKKESDT